MNAVLKKVFSSGVVQVTVMLGGLALTLVNLYISSLVRPLADNIANIEARAQTLEKYSEETKPLIERFYIAEEKTTQTAKDIAEIKESQLRLETKMDKVIENK